MKSILFNKYGNKDALKIEGKDRPIPTKGEVLVRLKASSINDWDWGLLRAKPFINRLLFGFTKPNVKTLGIDVSGVVESMGEGAELFQTGDAVYGDLSDHKWGGFAEYVAVTEAALRFKPKNISHEEAASIPHSGTLAIQSFLDYGTIKEGDEILINGAGGGAGTLAIQLGKYYKAKITAVDKKSKLEMMRNLGADHVLDYLTTNFTAAHKEYDRIIDFAGSHRLLDYKKALKKGGLYLLVGGKSNLLIKAMLFSPIISLFAKRKFKVLMHKQNRHLDTLTSLLESNVIRPMIGKQYSLEQASEALEYFGTGMCPGKIIIKID